MQVDDESIGINWYWHHTHLPVVIAGTKCFDEPLIVLVHSFAEWHAVGVADAFLRSIHLNLSSEAPMNQGKWRILLLTALLFTTLTISVHGSTISLTLDALPSQQGWRFPSKDKLSEQAIFSVQDGILRQDSMGLGLEARPYYSLPGVVDPDRPFVVTIRVRVLKEETVDARRPFGFSFYVKTGRELFAIGLGTHSIGDLSFERIKPVDNTAFHDFRLEGTPRIGWKLFRDDVLILTGAPHLGNEPAQLVIGDGAGSTNAQAEVASYKFKQEPTGVLDRVEQLFHSIPKAAFLIVAFVITLLPRRFTYFLHCSVPDK